MKEGGEGEKGIRVERCMEEWGKEAEGEEEQRKEDGSTMTTSKGIGSWPNTMT